MSVGVDNQDIELGVVGLPGRVRPFCTMPINQLVTIAKCCVTLMRERNHGRVKFANNCIDAAIRRSGALALFCHRNQTSMNRSDRRSRLAEEEAFDQANQFIGHFMVTYIGPPHAHESDQTRSSVPKQPPLGGTQRNSGVMGGCGQGDVVLEVRPQRCKSDHRYFALHFRQLR